MKQNCQLAILGGEPVLQQTLRPYNSMGEEEVRAASRVIQSGCLSAFLGSAGKQFLGGPQVRALEGAWCERFSIKHTVSMNSATSGLFAAMGAIGIGPGDEVIVPPFTMSATAMAPLLYGGIPVFADIDPDTFCLRPQAVRQKITPRTRAILAVNLFGHPAPLAELASIAQEQGLWLIEDNAQAPLATELGLYCGTVGHIGVFSLNYHKHIHAGEGGMCVTKDDDLALRLQLIRNHAENLVEPLALPEMSNLVGFNFRMTELTAAVALEQLRKIDRHVDRRESVALQLTEGVRGLPGLTPPQVRPGCRHVYYVWGLRFEENVVGISREQFSKALAAEGFPNVTGYVRPLYLLPVFQKRIAIGAAGYPFSLSTVRYPKGLCPVSERIYEKELIYLVTALYDIDHDCGELLAQAVRKVYAHRGHLVSARQAVSAGTTPAA
jgi:perosamine synthetase